MAHGTPGMGLASLSSPRAGGPTSCCFSPLTPLCLCAGWASAWNIPLPFCPPFFLHLANSALTFKTNSYVTFCKQLSLVSCSLLGFHSLLCPVWQRHFCGLVVVCVSASTVAGMRAPEGALWLHPLWPQGLAQGVLSQLLSCIV